jgi:hypothetical protein
MELKKFNFINKKFVSFVLLIFTFGFLVTTTFAYQNKSLSLHFVDEEHNFALGKWLLQGDRLYSDLFSNHQPLAHIGSAAIQTITEPNSIFLLVKRHREFMIGFSALFSLFLVWRFGWPLFIFVAIYEPTKIFLLGNLFLSEALIIYPLIFILSILFLGTKQLKRWESIFVGFSLASIVFLLAPTWPLAFVLFLIFLFRSENKIVFIKWLGLGIFPILFLVFWFSSISDYLYQSIFINLKYFIPPLYSTEPITISLFKAFVAPVLSFFIQGDSSHTSRIIQLLSLLLIINTSLLLKKRKFGLAILLIFILFLSNLRYIRPGQEYYRGFHLLPWYSTLIFLTSVSCFHLLQNYHQRLVSIFVAFFLLIILGISFNEARLNLYKRSNMALDYYVNYSNQFSIGEAVRIMSQRQDTSREALFVMPDEWLVYWQSGLKPPSKLNVYYGWIDQTPELNSLFHEMFTKNLLTYFYCNCEKDFKYLAQFQELKKDGKPSMLYVSPKKLETLNREQIEQLQYYGFSIN